jgi:Glycosyl hydrolase family 26
MTWRQSGSDHRRWRGWRAAAVTATAIVLAVAVTACAAAGPSRRGQPTKAAGTGPPKPVVFPASSLAPAHGVLFGATVQSAGYSGPDAPQAAVAAFERTIGRRLAIHSLYVPWTGPIPSATVRWDLARGTIAMITTAPAPAGRIAAGAEDSTIRAQARQLKALHAPVLLRWFAEMNLKQDRSYTLSPAVFVAAWRRVHRIFRRAGATNVRWVWCPSGSGFAKETAQPYYPGRAYVDWICADGFNWAPDLAGTSWSSFAQIFSSFYQWGRSVGKPMLIGEFGSVEGRPGGKAAWFTQADRAIRMQFPAIRAVVYFESNHQNFGQQFDWRVTSSRSALNAFRMFAHDPYFSAKPPT